MVKKHFLFEKEFFISVISIAIPIAIQNVISSGVTAMDTIMLGQLGDIAVSGASLGGQPFFLMMIAIFGISGGGAVLISQYWGKGQVDVIRRVMRISCTFSFIVSVIFTFGSFLFPNQIMTLFSNEQEVIVAGASYLKTLSVGFIFYTLSASYLMALRAVEQVIVTTTIYAISFFVNVAINYMFIFGEFGAPALGVQGAAIGTVAARLFEFVAVLIYMYFIEKKIGYKMHNMFKIDKKLLPDFIRHSLPVMGNEFIWGMGSIVTGMIMGRIGATFVAANSIVTVFYQLVSVFTFGIANATAVVCGKTIGQGNYERAQKTAVTLNLVAICSGIITATITFLIKGAFIGIYEVTPEAKQVASDMMTVLVFIQPLMSIDIVNIIGVLRGGGDTKVALMLDGGGMWLINIPLSIILAFVVKAPAAIIYLSMRCDMFIKIIIEFWRISSRRWIRTVTREDL